jgi:hypothetical protein
MLRTFFYAFAVLLSPSMALAAYLPGQTLDPNCLPTDPTCLVINTNVVADTFTATSTTATSSFAGGFNIANGGLLYDRSTGFVGIGTTTPSNPLTISGTGQGTNILNIVNTTPIGYSQLAFTGTGRTFQTGVANASETYFGVANDWYIFDFTAQTMRMVINSSGNVGIGQTSPAYKLDVNGVGHFSSLVDAASFVATSSAATSTFAGGFSIGASQFVVQHATGNVGIGTTAPNTMLHIQNDQNAGTKFKIVNATVGTAAFSQGTVSSDAATVSSYAMSSGYTTSGRYIASGAIIDGVGIGGFGLSAVNGDMMFYTSAGAERMRINSSGNVGIGTTSPTYKLDVAGSINTDQFSGYKQAGNTILYASSTTQTLGLGEGAGGSWITSTSTSGLRSVAIGYQALNTNPTVQTNLTVDNTAIGYRALKATTVIGNTAVGAQALMANTSGVLNAAVGQWSQISNTTGNRNSSFGAQNLYLNTTGSNNIAVGTYASYYNSSATNTVAVGFSSSQGAATYSNQGGTTVGYLSGVSFTTGSDYNTLLGYQAGYGITTGSNNLILASATSSTGIANLTTGSQNILIGNNISLPSATASGQLNIGNIIYGTSIFGTGSTLSTGNIGIGTSTPTAQLSTTGTVRFSNFGAGTLQTDANGNLSVSSDERLKNIQGSFNAGLSQIELLNPILYQWKPETGYDTSSTYAGFSAQNVQSAIPEAVGQDGHGYLTLQDRPLIAAAVNAIKAIAGISDDFRVHLTAWLGDASNGIPAIFAHVGNFDTTNTQTTNTQTLCVDGQCLTRSDVHALMQMVQAQNGIGGTPSNPVSGGSPETNSPDGTSTSSDGTNSPAISSQENQTLQASSSAPNTEVSPS